MSDFDAGWQDQESSPELTYWKLSELEDGDQFEGVFVQKMENTWEKDGKRSTSTSFKLLTTEQELIAINSTVILADKMKDVPEFSYVRIIKTGVKEAKSADKNDTQLVNVQVATKLNTEMAALVEEARHYWREPKAPEQPQEDRQVTGGRRF